MTEPPAVFSANAARSPRRPGRGCEQSSGRQSRIVPVAGLVAGIGEPPIMASAEHLLSFRAVVVSHEARLRDLFREAAPLSALPTEIVDCGHDADIAALPPGDICYLDGALPQDDLIRLVAELRSLPQSPFSRSLRHDVDAECRSCGSCARARRGFPQEAVFSARHRKRAVRLLRPPRAQSGATLVR